MTTLVAGQIVFLECRQTRLYAEVIQVLEARCRVWVRPLALASEDEVQALGTSWWGGAIAASGTVPDMVWPLEQLQPALDTDILPLVAQLSAKSEEGTAQVEPQGGGATVSEFLHRFWADS